MPSFIWLPSSLAAPLNGAEIPKRISLSVTPRMLGELALGASIVATRGGATLVGCGAADAAGRPAVAGAAEGGCGAADAIERPAAAGAALAGCGAGDAIGRPAVGGAALVGCGGANAIGRPSAGEFTCADVVGASSLDLASVVFGLNPSNLRHVGPSVKYIPIAAPNATAMMRPAMEANHPGLQGVERKAKISGSSDRSRFDISLSEEGRAPILANSPS